MRKAIRTANETIAKFDTSEPEIILEKLGIGVLNVELAGKMKEVCFDDYIVLKAGLPETERRQLLAHALCHQLLHAGNHLIIKERGYSCGNYHEKQADVFAAYLLLPESEFERLSDSDMTADLVAEKFDVDRQFAMYRIELAKNSNPKKYAVLVGAYE